MMNEENIKKGLKGFSKYVLVYLIMIMLFMSLLTVTSLIPRELIKENVQTSAKTLNRESNRLLVPIRHLWVMFDNYTDALMINTAYSIDSSTPFFSSMVARKNFVPGKTKLVYMDMPGDLRSASKYEELDQVGELNDTVNDDIEESFEYARYWHGYLVFLRPILCLMDIGILRQFMLAVFIIIAAILLGIVAKKVNILSAIRNTVFGLVLGDYLYINLTLQSTPIYLVAMISSIVILIRGEKIKNIGITFFIIGGIACFVDFLTVPILSLRTSSYDLFFSFAKAKGFDVERNGTSYSKDSYFLGNWIWINMVYQMGFS